MQTYTLIMILDHCGARASERCRTEKRKTINGEDIIHAIRTLGFDNYVEPLTVFLCKYREVVIVVVWVVVVVVV